MLSRMPAASASHAARMNWTSCFTGVMRRSAARFLRPGCNAVGLPVSKRSTPP
jgi:hypothetical protein